MDTPSNSVPNNVRHRRFLVLDRHKQSQPQRLDDIGDEYSPRSIDSPIQPSAPVQFAPATVAIQVEDEEGFKIEDLDTMEEFQPSPSVRSKKDDDLKSELSFIMKEKLHVMAREVQRRTSAVRESLIKEEPEDTFSTTSASVPTEEQQPSLMSLIGLQKEGQDDAEDEEKWQCRLPETLHPYGRIYMTWLFLVTSAFLYNAYCIPLRSSYPYQTKSNLLYWLILDYTCDIIYFIDMVLIKPRLRFMKGGISVKARDETLKHYLMSSVFKLDLFAMIPTDLIYIYTGPTPIWRLNKLTK
ncbi:hypothetical protein COOONC_20709, partial [Cooperia oncophora]